MRENVKDLGFWVGDSNAKRFHGAYSTTVLSLDKISSFKALKKTALLAPILQVEKQ